MQVKSFGSNGILVPSFGLGCARIGSFNNPASPRDTARLLERALDLGVALFDTADVYGQGDSERAIGDLLRGRRDSGFVVTKAGIRFSTKMRLVRPLKPLLKPLLSATAFGRDSMTSLRRGVVDHDFSPGRIAAALEASLRRLRMAAVDAFLLHGAPAEVIRDPLVIDVLLRLRREGKTKVFGVSCDDATSLSAALEMPGLEIVEVTRAMLDGLTPGERETRSARRIGVLVREVLRDRAAVPAARVLTDLVRRGDVTCAIVGTTSIAHLEELATAVGLEHWTRTDFNTNLARSPGRG